MPGDVWAAVSRVSRALFQIDGNQKWKWHTRRGEAPSRREAMAPRGPALRRKGWQLSQRGLQHPHPDSCTLINGPEQKAGCSQWVWRTHRDPHTACCTVDQASFYRSTSPSASWHLQATQKFLSIKELAGGCHYGGRYLKRRKWVEEQLPAPSGEREARGYEYLFLTLVWEEESIPSATWWREEGTASLTSALLLGRDMACDNLQNRWRCFVLAERGGACSSLLSKSEKGKVQKILSGWEARSSGLISLESHHSAYLMS